jgi:SAM-dependent methyltransferase
MTAIRAAELQPISSDRHGHTGLVTQPAPPSAQYFDDWYANMASSGIGDEIQQRHLGLPAHLLSTSLLTWGGIADVTEALELTGAGTLLDLACGRGGYGLEVASRTGARLIGVDFSAEALRQARHQAERLGRDAEFRLGDLTATGLESGSVTGVLCVDAVQFADPSEAAFAEMRRVLAPGGRAVLTGWEALDRADDRVPARLRRMNFAAALAGAGFAEVQVLDRSMWRERERAMWEDAAALDPGSDPSLQSFHDEGVRVLETFPLIRRVLAIGVVPS